MKFDGNDHGGNPEFFFLPPLARDPKSSPNYDAGQSNVALTPTVEVCRLNVSGATQAAMQSNVTASTPCISPLVFSQTLGAGNVSRGLQDDNDIDLVHFIATHYPSLTEPYYHVGWKLPVTAPIGSSALPVFYRVSVRVGSKSLGFLDVESVNNFAQLINVNTGDFVPLTGGLRLPINFRIENRALCDDPADKTKSCASQAVDLSAGGTVAAVLDPVHAPLPSGITIPPAAGGSTVNITIQSCPDFNPQVTDLPTFGSCVRVTAEPALPPGGFAAAVTVFNCNVSDVTVTKDDPATGVVGKVRNHEQADRITLHQLDFVDGKPLLVALPHTPACGVTPPVSSVRGVLDELRHGRLGAATRQMLAMLTPKSAYAGAFIDLGGGGLVGIGGGLSDFQFALPAKFTIDATTDNAMVGPNEAATPAVVVSDLDGQPVSGATVSFAAGAGSASPTSVVTGGDGRASTVWTVGPAGTSSTLLASGRGIAGNDNNGPRDGVDPFQPIQALFNPSPLDQSVTVLTGSVLFHATSLVSPVGGFGFGSDGFRYTPIAIGGTPPGGFSSMSFDASSWSLGTAPFGSGGCAAAVTPWPIYTGILARKSFSTRTAGALTVQVHIDNDIRVWVDGNEITSTGTSAGASYYDASSGWWIHDQCVLTNPPTFTAASVPAGNHLLAVWATDRGGDSHLDVQISQAP